MLSENSQKSGVRSAITKEVRKWLHAEKVAVTVNEMRAESIEEF